VTRETSFDRKIRTKSKAQPMFPASIETVEVAIDHVQELPQAMSQTPHWNVACAALWQAANNPNDYEKLKLADKALRDALKAEGWLNEIKLA